MNEYLELGKELSDKYITNGEDLTQGLQKIATSHSFNEQQLKRIAENANVETYLKLAEQAPDGYVEFDVADSSVVIDNLEKNLKKEASLLMAKDNIWEDIKARHANALVEEMGTLTKVASVDPELGYREISQRTSDLIQKIAEYRGAQAEITSSYKQLTNLTTNAIAEGYSFGELSSIIKEASDAEISEDLIEVLKEDLQPRLPIVDFEKMADTLEVNTSSSYYKTASTLSSLIQSTELDYSNIVTEAGELVKVADSTTVKHYIKEAVEKVAILKEAKYGKLKTLALTTGIALPVGAALGVKKEQYKNNKSPRGK